jgi:hypothetical protein
MPYRTMGWIHATFSRLAHDRAARGRDHDHERERGQGLVEYVGLMLLIATLLAGVLLAAKQLKDTSIAKTIANKLKEVIESVKPK